MAETILNNLMISLNLPRAEKVVALQALDTLNSIYNESLMVSKI